MRSRALITSPIDSYVSSREVAEPYRNGFGALFAVVVAVVAVAVVSVVAVGVTVRVGVRVVPRRVCVRLGPPEGVL